MFLGHYALGLAAKKIDSKPSLGTMLMAAQFIDLLWPLFLIFGIESVKIEPGNTSFTPLNFTHYPWSHSLLATVCWALLFGVVYYIFSKNRKGALLLAVLVISHWLLDYITHRPDLPLTFSGDEKFGLGMWNNKILTLATEGIAFVLGVFIYLRTTKPVGKKGRLLIWSFIILISAIYIMSSFGPPPTSEKMIMYSALGQWLFIAWAYWIDKNRIAV
ncbi:MAG: hypothetical protein EPN92_10155 [Chitinophagaceae bacterium]|nr:MAG: hypothetical protein EPN92_10155 [Chitinophagaceae bacterium]